MQVKLIMPWMHGMDHDAACQLKYSGLYTVSAGATAGCRALLHFIGVGLGLQLTKPYAVDSPLQVLGWGSRRSTSGRWSRSSARWRAT